MPNDAPAYLTVRELAALLRVKERKVYDLAASGEIPCTRAMGKLLFPSADIDAWLARHSSGPRAAAPSAMPSAVLAGSHDPLLEWALRESRSGIAAFFDGSLDGLRRMKQGEAAFAGVHLHEPDNCWNTRHVAEAMAGAPVVLIEWAWRDRGLIVPTGNPDAIEAIGDVAGHRVVPRQPEAGTRILFDAMLREAGIGDGDITLIDPPARTEDDVAIAIADGKADLGCGLAGVAHQFRLDFVPLLRERYDLVVHQRAYFMEPFQQLLAFCRSDAFGAEARALGGYDISGLGNVHYVG